jgi:FtsZ-binding cell division protein ZapB
MRREGTIQLAHENAELRQRVEELEKENRKLKRKLAGERERNDPRNKLARALGVTRKQRRFTDEDEDC